MSSPVRRKLVRLLLDQVLEARLDLDAVLVAADQNRLLEGVLAGHHAVSLDGAHPAAERRQRAPEREVRVVFVAQTALETPAHAGELRGVQRETLLLGHLHRDGAELAEPARAAKLAPARA